MCHDNDSRHPLRQNQSERDSDYDCRNGRCLPTSRKRLVVPLRKWERPRQQAMADDLEERFSKKNPDLPMPTVAPSIQTRLMRLKQSGAKPGGMLLGQKINHALPRCEPPTRRINARLPSSDWTGPDDLTSRSSNEN